MKIIIPMTGYGSRFVAAGYNSLKPFIKIGGKPIIQWIVQGMFANDDDFLFVCRGEHLREDGSMEGVLRGLSDKVNVFKIDDWVKKGPVVDVLRASKEIDDDEPCIICYCDFYMSWEWKKYREQIINRGCEGCVPCYTGFHPHLIPQKNLYASCLTDNDDNLIEIREKYSFEEDKTLAKHSPGVYYFKTGALLKKYCKKLVDSGQSINGEYYASMPYNFMVEDGLNVWIPTNIEYFCQWGTPEDMRESLYWINLMMEINR